MNTTTDFAGIHNKARDAALEAAKIENERLGPENARGFDCGFGWATLRPATHPFVRWLKANGIGAKHWDKGWWINGHILDGGIQTQSVSVEYQAARAYCEQIRRDIPELTCFASQRLD